MNMSTDPKTAGHTVIFSATEQMPAEEYLRAMKSEAESDDFRTNIHSLWDPTGSRCRVPGSAVRSSASGGCVMRGSLAVTEEITYRLSGSFCTAA